MRLCRVDKMILLSTRLLFILPSIPNIFFYEEPIAFSSISSFRGAIGKAEYVDDDWDDF